MRRVEAGLTVYTVGHSTRGWQEFLELLRGHGVEAVADVRRWPTSRRYPHFRREAMEAAAGPAGLTYRWFGEALGGYRRPGEVPGADAPGFAGLRSPGFRAYAAHLRSAAAQEALAEVLWLAAARSTAVLCAERHPFRCHRRLIADRLVAAGHRVLHLIDGASVRPHRLPPGAAVVEGWPWYPEEIPPGAGGPGPQ